MQALRAGAARVAGDALQHVAGARRRRPPRAPGPRPAAPAARPAAPARESAASHACSATTAASARVPAREHDLRAGDRGPHRPGRELQPLGVRDGVLGPPLGDVELAGGDRRRAPAAAAATCGASGRRARAAARRPRPSRSSARRGSSSSPANSQAAVRVSLLGSSARRQRRALARGALGLGRLPAHVVDERADPEREVQQVRNALQPRGLLGRLGLVQRGVELEPERERDRPQADQRHDELALAGAARDRQRPHAGRRRAAEALVQELRDADVDRHGRVRGERGVVEPVKAGAGAVERLRRPSRGSPRQSAPSECSASAPTSSSGSSCAASTAGSAQPRSSPTRPSWNAPAASSKASAACWEGGAPARAASSRRRASVCMPELGLDLRARDRQLQPRRQLERLEQRRAGLGRRPAPPSASAWRASRSARASRSRSGTSRSAAPYQCARRRGRGLAGDLGRRARAPRSPRSRPRATSARRGTRAPPARHRAPRAPPRRAHARRAASRRRRRHRPRAARSGCRKTNSAPDRWPAGRGPGPAARRRATSSTPRRRAPAPLRCTGPPARTRRCCPPPGGRGRRRPATSSAAGADAGSRPAIAAASSGSNGSPATAAPSISTRGSCAERGDLEPDRGHERRRQRAVAAVGHARELAQEERIPAASRTTRSRTSGSATPATSASASSRSSGSSGELLPARRAARGVQQARGGADRPRGDHEQHRDRDGPPQQVHDELDGGLVGPVQVVEQDRDRRRAPASRAATARWRRKRSATGTSPGAPAIAPSASTINPNGTSRSCSEPRPASRGKPAARQRAPISASRALLPSPVTPISPSTRPAPRLTSPIARMAEASCGSRPSNSMHGPDVRSRVPIPGGSTGVPHDGPGAARP